MPAAVKCVGIDHGTTNSALALMDADGLRVVKPDGVHDIMPSVVYINKSGRMLVGQPARNAMMSQPPGEGNGYGRYKRRIGQDDRYDFSASRKVLSAPDAPALLDWLRRRPLLHREGSHLLVHAGLAPAWDLPRAEALAREVEAALAGEGWRKLLAGLGKDALRAWSEGLPASVSAPTSLFGQRYNYYLRALP